MSDRVPLATIGAYEAMSKDGKTLFIMALPCEGADEEKVKKAVAEYAGSKKRMYKAKGIDLEVEVIGV